MSDCLKCIKSFKWSYPKDKLCKKKKFNKFIKNSTKKKKDNESTPALIKFPTLSYFVFWLSYPTGKQNKKAFYYFN